MNGCAGLAAAVLLSACASTPTAPLPQVLGTGSGSSVGDPVPGDLVCKLTRAGHLSRCELVGESAARLPAALRAAREEGLPRLSRDAAAVEAIVRLPLAFDGQGRARLNGSVIEYPAWLRRPNGDEVEAAEFLGGASRRRITGWATFHCAIDPTGMLTDCTQREAKGHPRVGEAVLYLSRYFRARPAHVNGAAVSGDTLNVVVTLLPD